MASRGPRKKNTSINQNTFQIKPQTISFRFFVRFSIRNYLLSANTAWAISSSRKHASTKRSIISKIGRISFFIRFSNSICFCLCWSGRSGSAEYGHPSKFWWTKNIVHRFSKLIWWKEKCSVLSTVWMLTSRRWRASHQFFLEKMRSSDDCSTNRK